MDCVLFASDDNCLARLGEYAKAKLRDLSGWFRVAVANKSDDWKRRYHAIMTDSAAVSRQIFTLPEDIQAREDEDGESYSNHLFVSRKVSEADGMRFARLELTDIVGRDKVLLANSDDELRNIFAQ